MVLVLVNPRKTFRTKYKVYIATKTKKTPSQAGNIFFNARTNPIMNKKMIAMPTTIKTKLIMIGIVPV